MYEAELYSKNNSFVKEMVGLSLRNHGNHLEFLGEPLSIIEIGMGDGNVTEHCLFPLLPEGTKYIGTDASKEMIEFAGRNERFARVELDVLDITTNELPEKYRVRFDRVIGFNVLHCVTNVRKSLENIYDMLRPGGKCYLILFERTPADGAFDKISKNPKWSKYGTDKFCSVTYRSGEGARTYYPRNMEEIGFKDVEVFLNVLDASLDPTAFKEIIISVNQALKNVPETERTDYIEDYLKAIMEEECNTVDADGNVWMHLRIFTVCASK